MKRALEILLVEDNIGDQGLAQEVLGRKTDCHLHVVSDGEEALDFLFQRGTHASAPVPALVLLDLNLPKVHGFEVLEAIRSDARLKRLPVIVLTTSTSEPDLSRAYGLGVSCYLKKPLDVTDYFDLLEALFAFWSRWVELPPGG